jgi:hypothetical protein
MRRHKTSRLLACAAGIAVLLASGTEATAGLINGDFGTGDLTGWTAFTTPNGTLGAGFPQVVQFDTLGTGTPVNSAEFLVGEITFDGTQQGGGLFQNVHLGSGNLNISVAIAALGQRSGNAQAGVFSILFDGVPVATHTFGSIGAGQALRFELTASLPSVTGGDHQIAIEMTRRFITLPGVTPEQFFTDVTLSGSAAAPEPSTFALTALGVGGLVSWRRWRKPRA